MKYNEVLKEGQLLAIADEDGYVSIVDTSDELPESLHVSDSAPSQVKAQWLAHNNSVFQVEWIKVHPRLHEWSVCVVLMYALRCAGQATCMDESPSTSCSQVQCLDIGTSRYLGERTLRSCFEAETCSDPELEAVACLQGDSQMLTAAADFTIRQWDTLSATNVSCLCGHGGSVKCLSTHPTCPDVFASGPHLPDCVLQLVQHANCPNRAFFLQEPEDFLVHSKRCLSKKYRRDRIAMSHPNLVRLKQADACIGGPNPPNLAIGSLSLSMSHSTSRTACDTSFQS
jgi:hypothetical protein